MILSLALRNTCCDELLGELIGLSTPGTIILLKTYKSVPLLMRPGMITSLAHATARNLTQCRAGNKYQYGSKSLLQHVPDVIASIITQMDLNDDFSNTLLGETFQQLAHNWPKSEDQSAAGIREDDRHEVQDRGKKKVEYVGVFVQMALKALAAIPIGGRAFTAFEPIANFTSEKRLAKLKEMDRDAWKAIYGYYLDNVETKIRHDGEYEASWNNCKEALKEVLDVTDGDLAAQSW